MIVEGMDRIAFGRAMFSLDVLDLPAKGEDAHLVAPGFIGISDGATPLGATALSPANTATMLLSLIAGCGHRSASDAVREAISHFASGDYGADIPSASLVFLRHVGDDLELDVLSDCAGVIALRDGSLVETPIDEVHARLDREVLERIGEAVRSGVPFHQARAAETEALRHNRALMNTPEGYWVFANHPDAADHVATMRVHLDEVESVLICSDGFSRFVDPFHIVGSMGDLLAWSKAIGLECLGKTLRAIEMAPSSHVWAPRFGDHDDITAILLTRTREDVR